MIFFDPEAIFEESYVRPNQTDSGPEQSLN